jgi:glycosyltransferase involved in cell wall biosynthesis
MIVVDSRWSGQNGIGRYSREVLSRLAFDWSAIEQSGSPSSPHDFLTKNVRVGGIRPDAIYSPGYNGFLRGVPQTVTVHDLIHLEGPSAAKYRPYYNLFLRPLIKKNRHVITVSETSKRHIEKWLDDDSVTVVNAGNASSSDFHPKGAAFESPRPYFLYVGNLRAHKNVETVVRALAAVEAADLFFVTSDGEAALALGEKYGVSSRIRVFSGIDDVQLAELYRGARATVQPSLLEGFGLPALEAALSGSPVIFFDGCESVREICAGGGISVGDSSDAREWSAAMASVAEGDKFPAGMVRAEQYSWSSVAAKVEQTVLRFRR